MCFISRIDRFTLDTKGGGFDRHTAHDHNMWMYLYMFCYLWDKEETEYNGWEQHVRDRMDMREVDFLPNSNAIVLREVKMAEEEEANKQRESVEIIKADVEKIAAMMPGEGKAPAAKKPEVPPSLEGLQMQNTQIVDQMNDLKAQQEDMRKSLAQLLTLVSAPGGVPRKSTAAAAPPPRTFVPPADASAGPASARRPSDVKSLRSKFEVPGGAASSSQPVADEPQKPLQKRPTKFEL